MREDVTDWGLTSVLEELARLLEAAREPDWAASLRRLRLRLDATAASPPDYQRVLRDVLAVFSGMGSLSDLVLYRDGAPLQAENDHLAHLRNIVFEAAISDLK